MSYESGCVGPISEARISDYGQIEVRSRDFVIFGFADHIIQEALHAKL
jgi:hypothetical protein